MNVDQTPFFGRKAIIERIRHALAVRSPAAFVLVGARLTGKSALLRQVESLCRPPPAGAEGALHPYAVARLDCALISPAQTLWPALFAALSVAGEEQRHPVQRNGGSEPLREAIQGMVDELALQQQFPVLLLDNFDQLLAQSDQPAELCAELHTLAGTAILILTTQKPLYDLHAVLAQSSLASSATQLFLGLLEPEAAQQWLSALQCAQAGDVTLGAALLPFAGRHPFLLHKMGDCLAEVEPLIPQNGTQLQWLPLLRLRLAEHGRPLFLAQWALLHSPPATVPPALVKGLLERLQRGPLAPAALSSEMRPALNWLINQALIAYGGDEESVGYTLYSPLFAEYLVHAAAVAPATAPAAPPLAASGVDPAVYDPLTKIEASLLRYLQDHSRSVVSTEQLLADVWKRPDASTRRVQEAIRRLRLQLEGQTPPVGEIKNERGRGYRFVPAQPSTRFSP